MKKIFAFVATALVAFGFTACKQNPDEPKKDSIKVEMSEGLIFDDQTADPEQGWWQVYGSTEEFLISLSNAGTVTQVEGVYEASAFDADYTYYATATDTVQFTAGSIKVSKLAADEYTFVGNLDKLRRRLRSTVLTLRWMTRPMRSMACSDLLVPMRTRVPA